MENVYSWCCIASKSIVVLRLYAVFSEKAPKALFSTNLYYTLMSPPTALLNIPQRRHLCSVSIQKVSSLLVLEMFSLALRPRLRRGKQMLPVKIFVTIIKSYSNKMDLMSGQGFQVNRHCVLVP